TAVHKMVCNFTGTLRAGCQIAGLASAPSGLPWNVTTGVDNNLDTQTANDRPDLAVPGGDPLDKGTYFANFTRRVGNLPRNYNRGPRYFSLDMRLSKHFALPRTKIELFAEAFNLTNLVHIGTPVGNLRSASLIYSAVLATAS